MATPSLRFAFSAGIISTSLIALPGTANAFTFITNYSGTSPQGDIFLESVIFETGEEVSDFSFVSEVEIVLDTTNPASGLSADRGDRATTGVVEEDATSEDLATNLGNNNLNNIVDTENSGSVVLDLTFGDPIDNLLIWERGMNSQMGIQALDSDGNPIGNYLILDSSEWLYAEFDSNTTEVGSAQPVGSIGISTDDFGVSEPISGIRFTSERGFRGPDWKVVGTTADIPEPSLVLGLAVLGGAWGLRHRRQQDR